MIARQNIQFNRMHVLTFDNLCCLDNLPGWLRNRSSGYDLEKAISTEIIRDLLAHAGFIGQWANSKGIACNVAAWNWN
jgi:hypothetical protein